MPLWSVSTKLLAALSNTCVKGCLGASSGVLWGNLAGKTAGKTRWSSNMAGKSHVNGGFHGNNIHKCWIFQHSMFDYWSVPCFAINYDNIDGSPLVYLLQFTHQGKRLHAAVPTNGLPINIDVYWAFLQMDVTWRISIGKCSQKNKSGPGNKLKNSDSS